MTGMEEAKAEEETMLLEEKSDSDLNSAEGQIEQIEQQLMNLQQNLSLLKGSMYKKPR